MIELDEILIADTASWNRISRCRFTGARRESWFNFCSISSGYSEPAAVAVAVRTETRVCAGRLSN